MQLHQQNTSATADAAERNTMQLHQQNTSATADAAERTTMQLHQRNTSLSIEFFMYILCYLFVTSIRCYSLLYSWFRNTNDAACNFWLVSSSTKYLIVGSLIVSGLRKFAKKGWKVSKVAKNGTKKGVFGQLF